MGEGSSILLGHRLPHGCQHVAQLLLLSLGMDVHAHPLLDELDVLSEAPAMPAVSHLLTFFVTLWPLLSPTAMR